MAGAPERRRRLRLDTHLARSRSACDAPVVRSAVPRAPSPFAILALALPACLTRAPSSADEIEVVLRAGSKTIVNEETFVLHSPYGEAATAEYAGVVRDETALVRGLFGDAGPPAVRI